MIFLCLSNKSSELQPGKPENEESHTAVSIPPLKCLTMTFLYKIKFTMIKDTVCKFAIAKKPVEEKTAKKTSSGDHIPPLTLEDHGILESKRRLSR